MEELALHILDLVENSIRAESTKISIQVMENRRKDRMDIRIEDNGKGMDKETLHKAVNPFFTSREGKTTGLGLALFAQAAGEAGGKMEIHSAPGKGTSIHAFFQLGHIDRKPTGNIAETVDILKQTHEEIEFDYEYIVIN